MEYKNEFSHQELLRMLANFEKIINFIDKYNDIFSEFEIYTSKLLKQ